MDSDAIGRLRMRHLSICLLGGFQVRVRGRCEPGLTVKKAQALLAYLALHPDQPQPREKLATLLWGETAEEFARANLRQTLAVLRKALAHRQCPCILNAGAGLYLDGRQAEIDVRRFEQYCKQATPAALEEAVLLYRGELLEGFSLDEDGFVDWLRSERQRLHEGQLQVLNTLLEHAMAAAQHERAIEIAGRLLALDPLQEPVHRRLMQCYQAQGQRHLVLRQYRICREVLQRELEIEPEAETERLYRQLLSQSPAINTLAHNPPVPKTSTALPGTAPVAASPSAERRQLTVMRVSLADATVLAERFDPEDLGRIMRAFQDCCSAIVSRYDGHAANYMDNGILVHFGSPRAHEDDAERALHAGLAIIAAVHGLNLQPALKLQTRIGVATGLVVVGETLSGAGDKAQSVVGETPNLAARLHSLAAPDTLVISAETHRLASGVFNYEALVLPTVKGLYKPLRAWRVLGTRMVENRFEAHHSSALGRLVGRAHELGLLSEHWQQAKAGAGQLVLLSGEAGIGKSRIARALSDALAAEAHYRINYQCSPYHTDSPLYPVIQQLTRAAGFADADSVDGKLDKLEAVLGAGAC